ncbi:TetR/AcrR family transcriptional regulator [Sciscionella sediminilitoris]|uniref:TetR/AcrR family transcriptional regulator n=1 Tax=Sciscionella sediminilitoris TaxID=1445613 RepID=UPI0004DF6D60|nr:TetR family transcriptional regulator C-terminal domain-containing protein [Sciscionella sp. SE31]
MATREQNRAEREKRVIEAASAAIGELGLSAVRVSDIAERAGMTTGHVTYYFPSKSDLLMLAIRLSEEALIERAKATLAAIEDPWNRLDHLIGISVAKEHGDPGWLLWFQVWADAATNERVAEVHNELDARWRDVLREVLDYGRTKGTFRFTDLDETATLLSSALDGLSIQLTIGAPDMSAKRLDTLARSLASALLD